MTAKYYGHRGKRARLLGSIFAPAPHSAPLSGEPGGTYCGTGKSPRISSRKISIGGWRDVTAGLARAEMAEDICSRFFTEPPQDSRDVCAGRLDGGMATAGQRLQALSTERHEGELSGIDLPALLCGVAREADRVAASQPESAGASLQSLLTARAA